MDEKIIEKLDELIELNRQIVSRLDDIQSEIPSHYPVDGDMFTNQLDEVIKKLKEISSHLVSR